MIQKNQILVTSIFLLGVVLSYGQTSSNAGGGEASGNGGSASYSIGQVVYTPNQSSVEMSNLVPATYFIKVIQSNKEIKPFKIKGENK